MLLLELISWLITMHRVDGGCAECMKCIHAVSAPVVARCIDCAFYCLDFDDCIYCRPMSRGDTLAEGCGYYVRENLTDCY